MDILNAMIDAKAESRALAAFNAATLEAMIAVGQASNATKQPAIIQTSAKLVKRYGALYLKSLFDASVKRTGGQCFLHLDHCDDPSIIEACIKAGWDMIMFDGSHLPIGENCKLAKEVVKLAHDHGVAVEAEVGAIGGEEDGRSATVNYAKADDIEMISATGIDCLAVGFGNVHGDYAHKTDLNWSIFEGAHQFTKLPLVLHGGSGLTDEEFLRAIHAGATKVNISTDFKKIYASVLATGISEAAILKDPAVLHDTLVSQLGEAAVNYIELFSGMRQKTKEISCN